MNIIMSYRTFVSESFGLSEISLISLSVEELIMIILIQYFACVISGRFRAFTFYVLRFLQC